MIDIEGYKLIRNDRNRHGGGICVYLKKSLGHRVLSKSPNCPGETEHLVVEIKNRSEKLLLGVLYNPPNVDCAETLTNLLGDFTVRYDSTFFVGDFNTDLLKSSNRIRTFKESLDSMSYVCVNSEPTFFH